MDDGRKKGWQYAFLAGVVVCVMTAMVAFGLSLFAAMVGGAMIVISIINGLLSRTTAGASGNNWLLSKLKHSLNVGLFLRTATVAIWIISIGLGIYCINQIRKESRKREVENRKITIEGLVITAGGEPADGAIVTVFLNRPRETTTDKGRFIFPQLDFGEEPPKSLLIRTRWKTYEVETTVDLTKGPPQSLEIKLPPGASPLRVSYFLLEGHAIDFLLRGKMDKRWEEKLAGQPYIVPNSVSQKIKELVRKFGEKFNYARFEVRKEGKQIGSLNEEASRNYDKPFFVGGMPWSPKDGGPMIAFPDSKYINLLKDSRQPWRVFVAKGSDDVVEGVIFRKFANRHDLEYFDDPLADFYRHITKEYMPPDFGYIDMYIPTAVCGLGEPSTTIHFVGRYLSLRVAVVENVTNEPIKLTKFTIKENKSDQLRSREDDKASLDKEVSERQDLFPPEMLKPGEKIVIPVEMVLRQDNDMQTEFQVSIPKDRRNFIRELEKAGDIDFPIDEKASGIVINAKMIENILNRPNIAFTLNREYVYGPSISIESIEIDNVNYPFRQFDPKKIIITGEVEEGSCPYVYTYSPEDKEWLNEGVILYGFSERNKESRDVKLLRRFDGRVLIKEKDPEQSFIDLIFIRAASPDGGETILYPVNKRLRSIDKVYLTLGKGEQFEVEFAIPKGLVAHKYILEAVGYYIPYKRISKPVYFLKHNK
ncbi:MAG TPA: carboxypeptidase-like regulatory domain-containing protein [Pyrinomonadaceae bacterium]|jgi:hypothetical protein